MSPKYELVSLFCTDDNVLTILTVTAPSIRRNIERTYACVTVRRRDVTVIHPPPMHTPYVQPVCDNVSGRLSTETWYKIQLCLLPRRAADGVTARHESITDESYIFQQDNAHTGSSCSSIKPSCFVVKLPNSQLPPTARTSIRLITAG